MGDEQTCPRCRRPLSAKAPQGLCPECLMEAGFPTGAAPNGSLPTERKAFHPPPPSELAGLFPQLEIVELLGQGGMGAVYKARQKHLDRIVALKILPPGIGADPAFAQRFTREAKALARLNHPGVVTLYESGQVEGLYFFLMEFVDGVTLRYLLQGKRLTPREALAIVPQICDALQYAHDQGIIHRDIKPENILLDRQGRVKVADFGLAKLMQPDTLGNPPLPDPSMPTPNGEPGFVGSDRVAPAGVALTDPGKVMGTPHYMAPEQREHPTEVDHRADIYSLGVVFYEMLTGELPLGQFQPPSKKAALDVRLDEVVMGALAKEPEHRYQQASEVKNNVETIAVTSASASASSKHLSEPAPAFSDAGEPALAASLAMNPNIEPNSSLKPTPRTALLASLTTAFLLCSAFGLVWLLKTKPAPPSVATEPMSPQEALELTAKMTSPQPLALTFDALNNQGNDLLFKQNDAASAVPVFEACIRDYPNRSEGYHGLALAQRATGRGAEVITNHDRAIELTPDRADYYYARGTTYMRLNNYDMAISDFEMGLKQKPMACLAPGMLQTGLAVCYRAKGDLETALKYNAEAFASNPENNWIRNERQQTQQTIADRDRAEAALKEQAESQTKPE